MHFSFHTIFDTIDMDYIVVKKNKLESELSLFEHKRRVIRFQLNFIYLNRLKTVWKKVFVSLIAYTMKE